MVFEIKENVSLQAFNGMRVPVNARALTSVRSLQELKQAIDYAHKNNLSILVLGEGSNTIFENNYQGLVILNRIQGIELVEQDQESVTLKVAAGESWHDFVAYTIEQKLYGLENLALIPGLVGAAPIQNIGAYGAEVKDTIVSVEYFDITSGELKKLTNCECRFLYRESIFKTSLSGSVVITSVIFRLLKKASINISYPALSVFFSEEPNLEQVFDAVCMIRRSKLPLPNEIPNVGSFFKNPVVDERQHSELKLKYSDLVSYKSGDNYKLAAGWMIEKAGWKQKCIDKVCVHEHQALVIVNSEKQSGKAVINFAKNIQQDIAEKFGVNLEIEPRVY